MIFNVQCFTACINRIRDALNNIYAKVGTYRRELDDVFCLYISMQAIIFYFIHYLSPSQRLQDFFVPAPYFLIPVLSKPNTHLVFVLFLRKNG